MLRDPEIQAQFADYYYDYTIPSSKLDALSLAEADKKEAKKEVEVISTADVHVSAS